ncbi:DNA topoisomerase 1-like [Drosophila tropicalis]|uniref:DNA topoisomerase 1-like n=1 Tax=Drosophila tropicalis TaxID=46794 RepID=UPI0035ABC6BE
MLNHEYCRNTIFNRNFFMDFRGTMTYNERKIIKDFHKCNFYEIFEYFQAESNKLRAATKEEKLSEKEENESLISKYGFCLLDGHCERINNFRLEAPGLFLGRGDHPKMGMIRHRVWACDITINCGRDSKIPMPPRGEMWKEVRHDNTVTWLASWTDNVHGQNKYIILNPRSKIRCESDHNKYEAARRLHKLIDKIRATYSEEWKSKRIYVRQRAIALYFIDKLAGTVRCSSLRVEDIQLHRYLMDKEYVVVFDFLRKDSIRYYNMIEVEPRVFNNLKVFVKDKEKGDSLFECLNAHELNDHLKELMVGLTTKIFRTYYASLTLQNQLDELTDENATVPEKLLVYNRANRAVAILCNHQRSVPKRHQQIMENLRKKIHNKNNAINDLEAEFIELEKSANLSKTVKDKMIAARKGKQLECLKDQLKTLKLEETNREENKNVALTTLKLSYTDPRIAVAWCKKNNVPIEKIFNKTQRTKFLWAIHTADENYNFLGE